MGFIGANSNLSGASDVALSAPADNHVLSYNSATSKWRNAVLNDIISNITGASGATTLNLAIANVFNVNLTAAVTFSFAGAVNGTSSSFGLHITQGSGGNYSVSWPASVKWPDGTAPTLSTQAGSTDILVFESINGGTTWFGSFVGANYS
ncbi:MAG: hypothetical protein JWO54_287 [Candidatus Saccharibacteria bacterium]|nr:hypothetical protein [Candidatus Saccharibacteria bacterium]MDB5180529.1 hypothetical protein [Candidatus Saccharibacteria bacterium]